MNSTATQSHPPTTSTAMTGFMPGTHCGRGTLDIIWSCLSTTLLAIWVSLHLVVDSPYSPKVSPRTALEGCWEQNLDRFVLYNTEWPLHWRKLIQATIALIMPECVVTQSITDLYQALRLKGKLVTSGIKVFENFSLRQAFFIVQQGVYYNTDGNTHPNDAELFDCDSLQEYAQTGRLKFDDLPSDEKIADQSKSDRLLKSISIVQTVWFLANIIYRVCTGLQVSLLEDLTAAYAFCGLILFTAWFRCPQDVSQPFIVKLRSESDTPPHDDLKRRDTNCWFKNRVFGFSLLATIAFSLSAAGFTGIHLAAWNYSFASVTEKCLWRSCSLAMIPLLGIYVQLRRFAGEDNMVLRVVFCFFFILYVIARLILISLAFASFRKAPVGIYKDASWTDFIPHI